MLIIISGIATLLMGGWLLLLLRTKNEDLMQAADARIFDNLLAIEKLTAELKTSNEKSTIYSGAMRKIPEMFLARRIKKKIVALKKEITQLQNSGMHNTATFADTLIMPGYVLQREIESIGKSSVRKTIYSQTFELYGKKQAVCKTTQTVAKMISYPVLGVSVSLILAVIMLGSGVTSVGMGIIGLGTGLVLVLVYGIYDELCDRVNKRHKAISRQFPNVVSKLALLVTSGMIMDRAWKETAYSQDAQLYMEMRKTSEELDNLVSPEAAYAGFISRCNTKETAKLASAIMQNRSKGNSEIGKLLKDMAREVWHERRHTAKRDAEKANSKLMIPTMLLFLAILVMLMVPIAMNFTGI